MNATLRNRRARVNKMLRNTRRVKRQVGKRYLVKPSHIRFSNKNAYSNNNNINNSNNETWNLNDLLNNIHQRELTESRKSIVPSKPTYQNVRMNPKQAKLYANILSRFNDPNEMLNALNMMPMSQKDHNVLVGRIRSMFT